jgi:hypothetical protein
LRSETPDPKTSTESTRPTPFKPWPELALANGKAVSETAKAEVLFRRTAWTDEGPGGAGEVVLDCEGPAPTDAEGVGDKDIDGVIEIVGDCD